MDTEEATKKRILVIDDDPTLRDVYVEALRNAGYVVDTASDGEEGYRALESNESNYDLVVLDLLMPKLNGIEILEKLKNERPSRTFNNFIALTNVAHKDAIADVLSLGVRDYLIKDNSTPGDIAKIAKKYLTT